MAVLLRLNSFAMAGAATEILLRSMYVSRYIRLIKNRTIHRVFVGLNAVFSEIALDVRTGGRLVSNNLSVTFNRYAFGRDKSPAGFGSTGFSLCALRLGQDKTLKKKPQTKITQAEACATGYEITGARPVAARSLAPACQSAETLSSRMSTGRPSSADMSAA